MEEFKPECECKKLCTYVSAFQSHPSGSGGDLDPSYYAHHFDVGAVDDIYHLSMGGTDGQKITLRLVSAAGGRALIDVDHLAGMAGQVQLTNPGNWAELHFRCCQWHLADHQGATCV